MYRPEFALNDLNEEKIEKKMLNEKSALHININASERQI